MITARHLKADVIACLKAGPSEWDEAAKTLSSEICWLIGHAREQTDYRDVRLGFLKKFVWPAPSCEATAGEDDGDDDPTDVADAAYGLLKTQLACHRNWKRELLDKITFEEYPARKIIEVRRDNIPVGWREKWAACGGKRIGDLCVAHRLSTVWRKFSDFGQPYEPFEWSDALGTSWVNVDEAEKLGVAKGDSLEDLIADYAKRIGNKPPSSSVK